MNTKIHKWVALITACIFLTGLGTACSSPTPGNSSGSTPSGSTSSDGGGNGTINLTVASWWGGAQQTAFKDVFADYMSANPNVKITYQVYPYSGYTDKMTALAAGGSMPDIFMMDQAEGWTSYLYGTGILQPLDSLMSAANYSTSNWLPGVLQYCTVDGKVVAMPLHSDQLVTCYNAQLFADLGIPDLPSNPTWSQIWSDCQQITAAGKDPKTGVICTGWGGMQPLGLAAYVEEQGCQLTKSDGSANFDDPNVVAALQQYQNGLFSTYPPVPPALAAVPFAAGEQGIMIDYMGNIANDNLPDATGTVAYNFDNRVVNFPTDDGSSFVAVCANDFGISSTSKNQSAAFALLAYLTTDPVVGKLVNENSGVTPAIQGSTWTALSTPVTDKFPYNFYQTIAATPSSQYLTLPDGAWWYSALNALTTNSGNFIGGTQSAPLTPQMSAQQYCDVIMKAYNDWEASQ